MLSNSCKKRITIIRNQRKLRKKNVLSNTRFVLKLSFFFGVENNLLAQDEENKMIMIDVH